MRPPVPLSSLRAADVLEPEHIKSEEVPVTYCGETYFIAKGRAEGRIYFTVRGGRAMLGYKSAPTLAGIKKIIWSELA